MIANYYRTIWSGFRGRVVVGWAWSVSGLPLSLRTGLQRQRMGRNCRAGRDGSGARSAKWQRPDALLIRPPYPVAAAALAETSGSAIDISFPDPGELALELCAGRKPPDRQNLVAVATASNSSRSYDTSSRILVGGSHGYVSADGRRPGAIRESVRRACGLPKCDGPRIGRRVPEGSHSDITTGVDPCRGRMRGRQFLLAGLLRRIANVSHG